MEPINRLPSTHIVASNESPEFARLTRVLARSSVIGLDAEWKPLKTQQSTFPNVSLLQLACQLGPDSEEEEDDTEVFLLDLDSIPLPSIWELLKEVFISPDILKLGFRFKQDLAYLSSTFCSHGCDPGFDKVEPYLDITSLYHYLQPKLPGRKVPNETKSLATICKEILGISLSKELQCSDWSCRPLTEEQKTYAATDAHCLLQIFSIFKSKVLEKGSSSRVVNGLDIPYVGLQGVLQQNKSGNKHMRIQTCEALAIVRATVSSVNCQIIMGDRVISRKTLINTMPMTESLLKIVKKHSEKILLKASDRKPRSSKKRGKRKPSTTQVTRENWIDDGSWEGSTPWDISEGGDGCPKFLCDVMVEGLAKHLRCVGIDAAIPFSKKPEPRELIDQAYKEKRVLLTRDAKLMRHQHLIKNQIYRVKSLLKNQQLLEVIEVFNLKISEDRLMSRCTKCNGRFIQKPLTTEEAVEAAKGFQKIPSCLFKKNLEFWQCMECNQLYWEGTQYHNAVQKFVDICKLNEES
ncbi:Exonuclease mut-7 homolog [Linum perenne]